MSDLSMTSDWVAEVLAGCLLAPAPVLSTSVCWVQTDSRLVGLGDLFVCLVGERFDAHDFAHEVAFAGAVALVVERRLPVDIPQYVVQDARRALGVLAAAWRNLFDVKVLAVVGSNGKTTTKEMLASICRAQYGADDVLVTAGNLNNDIGVPHTLLCLRANHRVAVVEMGMNHPGEIDYLAGLVRPDVVLLTNAQREHQEFMKTVEAVARENGSAFAHLPKAGLAVFPAQTAFDGLWTDLSADACCERFGVGGAFWFESTVRVAGEVVLHTPSGDVQVQPAFLGEHNFSNAEGAAAAAMGGGCSLSAVKQGLALFRPVKGRLEIVLHTDKVLLINDSYNANPDSVNAASQVLAGLEQRNTLLVLGDMGEVGELSDVYHAEVGMQAKRLGVQHVLALGSASRHTVNAFGEGALHFDHIEELIEQVVQMMENGVWAVLVKGSRFMKMERVVEALTVHLLQAEGKKSHAS